MIPYQRADPTEYSERHRQVFMISSGCRSVGGSPARRRPEDGGDMARVYGLHSLFLILCTSLPLAARDAAAQPEAAAGAGCVVSVQGEALVVRGGLRLSASEGFALIDGDTLLVPAGASCRGFAPGGGHFQFDGPTKVALALQDRAIDGFRGWLARGIAQWTGKSRRQALTTRGGRAWDTDAEPCRPVFPVSGGVVRAASARLCWTTIPRLDRYNLVIATEDGAETSRTVVGNFTDVADLVPGERYLWQVSPAMADWPASSRWSTFRVLEPSAESNLDAAVASLPALEGAVALLATGLHVEAVERLDEARNLEPDNRSVLVWRAEVLAAMGRLDDAIADYRDLALQP